MSKKSTARTGSEGDADSATFTEVFTNICSGSSSCKSKRELDTGPFGDSPPSDRTQERYQDFLILMFQENEEPSETDPSENSDVDHDLYNLKNDYLEKLNIVRRRLNLIEISDDTKNIPPLPQNSCTITEILEDESNTTISCKGSQKENCNLEFKESCSVNSNNSENLGETYALNTIYPPSPSYNSADSASAISIFDVEYNPPKKKFCHRLRTPRFTSTSEGNIPYYTKVSLREDLFKQEVESVQIPKKKDSLLRKNFIKFTKTKETQCTEDELKVVRGTSVEETIRSECSNTNLFPKVIIEVKEEEKRDVKSVISQSSRQCTSISNSSKYTDIKASPTNFLKDYSEAESYATITMHTTIIETPNKKKKKIKRKGFGWRNKKKSSEQLTMWEEIRKLHSSCGSAEAETSGQSKTTLTTGDCNSFTIRNVTKYIDKLAENINLEKVIKGAQEFHDKREISDQYFGQYLKYKASLEQAKQGLALGARMVTNLNRFQTTVDNYYYTGTSFVSDEDKRTKAYSSSDNLSSEPKNKNEYKTFWKKFCNCLCLAPSSSD